MKQETLTDMEYSFRKKKTKREEFLEIMDEIIPWDEWVGVIEPYYEVAAAVAADGISGVHTEGTMNFLLNEAKRQGIGTILTRDTSRISRDTSSFVRFERKFRENGIRFEYLSKPDNELPVTPMMEAFAAAYKKCRTKNGARA